jgi:glycosyltransferase involved in cell wall biosynthesis
MACGVPVIVSSAAGVAEFVLDGGAGLVVPAGDDRALADAIERLFANPDLAQELSNRGRALAETSFSWAAIARQYERIYEEVTAIAAPSA